jgi:hypothetical protein
VVNEPSLTPREAELVTFDAVIPVSLDLTITLSRAFRYACEIDIMVTLVVRAADELLVVIDVGNVTADDVAVALTARGLASKALKWLGGLEGEIRDQVVTKVNAEIGEPAASGRVVDVGARIDAA